MIGLVEISPPGDWRRDHGFRRLLAELMDVKRSRELQGLAAVFDSVSTEHRAFIDELLFP